MTIPKTQQTPTTICSTLAATTWNPDPGNSRAASCPAASLFMTPHTYDPAYVAWNLPRPWTIPPPARLVWHRIRNEFEIRGQTGLTGGEGLYILAEPSPLGERDKHFNS